MLKNGILSGFLLYMCFIANAQQGLYNNEFPLKDVVLLDGPFKQARDLNIKTLLQYNVDRLLAPYLKEAGLKPKDSSYTNWDGLDGHIGGALFNSHGNKHHHWQRSLQAAAGLYDIRIKSMPGSQHQATCGVG